jgi:ATP-dependent exoDNAse (exonuclease V) alpha subunit
MLPVNAPAAYKDRETLWNAVEKVQNKTNSRYARMFEMALPNELSTEEQIELARNYIKENFVDKGMAADFALHKKDGNNHIHVMTTVRGFTKTGNWASMEKKDYKKLCERIQGS